jgi:hypothetical protein
VCLWDLNLLTVHTEHVHLLTPKTDAVVPDVVVGFESQARNLLGVRIVEPEIQVLVDKFVLACGEKICFNSFYL